MLLQSLLQNYPNHYMHLERYVDQKNYSQFCNYSEVAKKYTPLYGVEEFPVSCLRPAPERIFTTSKSRIAKKIRQDKIFLIHPDSNYLFPRGEKCFIGKPTASTRTLLLTDFFNSKIFAKLSLPKRISRFARELNTKSVVHGLMASSEISKLCRNSKEFACLPEFAGSTYKNIGCIFREFNPTPEKSSRHLIPCFSLYSFDYKSPKDKLIIEQIAELTGKNVQEILQWVLSQVISLWCKTVLETGISLELHAQNTLIEINKKFHPKRIVARDFTSVWIDGQRRDELGIETKFQQKIMEESSKLTRKQQHSLNYDFFTSHHFLKPFIETCCSKYGLSYSKIRQFTIETFAENFTENPAKMLPNECYGYTDEIFINKKPMVKIIRKKPFFR